MFGLIKALSAVPLCEESDHTSRAAQVIGAKGFVKCSSVQLVEVEA